MEEIREALREGLREEAAPISRRLAEVKGLSNNAIRRLGSIEATIEAERNARVDDLTLLVELLTEGWRAMNARLERIETLLGGLQERVEQPGAAVYRLPTADTR
jgi:L-lactate utilization protein LutB